MQFVGFALTFERLFFLQCRCTFNALRIACCVGLLDCVGGYHLCSRAFGLSRLALVFLDMLHIVVGDGLGGGADGGQCNVLTGWVSGVADETIVRKTFSRALRQREG